MGRYSGCCALVVWIWFGSRFGFEVVLRRLLVLVVACACGVGLAVSWGLGLVCFLVVTCDLLVWLFGCFPWVVACD